ncbi:hypothetical protein LUZ60_001286 [Juncus effusus]|nr:hypothetical protein LUZ60_001286 [Juncus effusus]
MSSFLFLSPLLLFFLHIHGTFAAEAEVEYIYPNFSASQLLYFDTNGVFLTSREGTFQAAIYKPGTQQDRYYLCLLHTPSSTVVWTANREVPISDRSSTVNLTPLGLSASYPNESALWSTPPLKSRVSALRLLETGNMMLLDAANNSLWQSFDYATDTLLSGQLLLAGSYLSSSTSDTVLSEGDYRLNVTKIDAILSWLGSTYWRMSNDINSIKDRDAPVAFLTTNDTGLYLLTSSGAIIFRITLPSAPLRIVKLGSDGHLQILSYQSASSPIALSYVFMAPSSSCDLPLPCGSLGLCLPIGNSSSCTCPPKFATSTHTNGCSPFNGNAIASNSCGSIQNSYISVGSGVTYFANTFKFPDTSGRNQSDCETLCTMNCSCTGYFFYSSSQSCFLLQQPLGSLANTSENSVGYIKIDTLYKPNSSTNDSSSPRFVAILLPCIAAFLVVLIISGVIFIRWRKVQKNKMKRSKSTLTIDTMHDTRSRPITDSDHLFSEDGDEIEETILLPGLPTRFTLAELEEVTNNFRTKIGSGGFGTVYKGELTDKSLVAVKKIEGVGVQRRREFCTEIAVIGSIHHVNLVRLRGFCAQGTHWLLVYEYMNRGSLERPLFRPTSTSLLEWPERMNIAIGAARGLAYLHSGCQPKIVHCDVKPENILLDDHGEVKIADFGLAKLLTPEQSGLFTTMRGTRGYLAPEWLTNTAISDRTDVYSFGMVLLELVRGKKNRSEHVSDGEWSASTSGAKPSDHAYFPLVALQKHEQKSYEELVDPRLEGKEIMVSEVERLVKTALCCLHEDPSLRPSMTLVVAMLEGTMEVWEPRVESLGFLRMYGRGTLGEYSAGTLEIEEFMKKNIIGGSGSRTSMATNSGYQSYLSAQQLSGPR